jgi:beta-N-acetylhexosaminidase
MSQTVEQQIDALLGKMSLKEKCGQCYTMSFYGSEIRAYHRRFVKDYCCGGLRVTPHVVPEMSADHFTKRKPAPYCPPEDYAARILEFQDMAMERNGIPLHIVTDQEGDLSIDILRGGLQLFPSNMGLAATGDPELAYRAAKCIARQLRAQGINWMHSPELDVNLQPDNPEVGMRAYSDDPEICAEFGLAMARGFLDGGVMPTLKHFPGRGDSVLDAHDTMDVLRKPIEELRQVELHPYSRVIESGTVCALMTAHNGYSALDDENIPASMSKRIHKEIIRGELGFEGVITTDAINMGGAIQYARTTSQACLLALKAGADLVLIKGAEKQIVESLELTIEAVNSGDLAESELDAKVRRILKAKFDLGLFDAKAGLKPENASEPLNDPEVIETCRQSFEQSVIVTRDRQSLLPLDPKSKVLVVEQYIPLYHEKCNDLHYYPGMFSEYMRQFGNQDLIRSVETDTPATEEDTERVMSEFAAADIVVFSNIFWRGSGSNRLLIRAAVDAGKKVILASNDAYDSYMLPKVGTVIISFGAVPLGQETAARVICGLLPSAGQWPLRLIGIEETVKESAETDHSITGHFSTR